LNGERFADLQLHSTASDGSDTPSEVVRRAARKGFQAIALTDHDTMEGVPEAAAEAAALGLELIPACELSSLDDTERQIDILAYGIDIADAGFQSTLHTIRSGRLGRAFLMVQRLNECGYAVSWERVQAIAGGENIGRPHVAKAMVEAGIVRTIKDAFTTEFILDGGRCYVQRVKITPGEAIAEIHRAGGVAVAAHPGRTGLSDDDVAALASSGLDGLEVHYPRHSKTETNRFLELVGRFDLLVTGGSDDHGDVNEGRQMGRVRLPWPFVERLKGAIEASRQRAARRILEERPSPT
jgi:predicted metal-dependent phosphoesterase TrpH